MMPSLAQVFSKDSFDEAMSTSSYFKVCTDKLGTLKTRDQTVDSSV